MWVGNFKFTRGPQVILIPCE